jgi:hypothetical protein
MPQAKLTLEYIDKSQNKTIREMFTDEKAGAELDRFVAKHRLHLSKEYSSGKPTGVEITGKRADVEAFITTFLSGDSGGGVYNLVTFSAQDICECGHAKKDHEDTTQDQSHPLSSGRSGDIQAGTHKGATKCRVCTDCFKFRPCRN